MEISNLIAYELGAQGAIKGRIEAPKSKSVLHRQIICAALSDGNCVIDGYVACADTEATLSVISSLGGGFSIDGRRLTIFPCKYTKTAILNCGESGSTARFIAPVAAALGCNFVLKGKGRLPMRPMDEYIKLFGNHGLSVTTSQDSEFFKCSGKLISETFKLKGDVSSQYITGVLLAAPLMNRKVTIIIDGVLTSVGYVQITLEVMRSYGINCEFDIKRNVITVEGHYRSGNHMAEGDWSGAAFTLCAGALFGDVEVFGLNNSSVQGDREIAEVLKKFGANVYEISNNSIRVAKNKLCGIKLCAQDIPDLVPIIAAVAAFADGITEISGVERLRFKESDRIAAIVETLSNIGAEIRFDSDKIIVNGKAKLSGGKADSFGDHRIAMMCAVASLGCEEKVILTNPTCVGKSYPAFYNDFKEIGGVFNGIDMG